MRNRVRWVILLVATMVSTSLGAWNPNTDPCLVFNMDFETHDGNATATDSVSNLVGNVQNKSADPNAPFVSDANAKFGTSCDLRNPVDFNGTDLGSCLLQIDPDASVFDFGEDWDDPVSEPNTVLVFSAWFGHHDGSGTIIGQRWQEPDVEPPEPTYYWWQFRLQSGKILLDAKSQNHDVLRMRTQKTLDQMGMDYDDWHQATVVFDRHTRLSSKIYVDGAPVKVDITGHDPNWLMGYTELANAFIGSGDNTLFDDYDGLLDEIRIYHRELNETEISLLYQWTPTNTGPWALLPLPNYIQVRTKTDLAWDPKTGNTGQRLRFGKNLNSPSYDVNLASDVNSRTNAQIGGPLDFNSVYYWEVDSNSAGGWSNGPVWKFTADVGYAIDPIPEDGATGVEVNVVNLQWTGSPDKLNFDVYLSENASMDPCTQVADDITDSNVAVFTAADPCQGKKYYWKVVTNFGSPSMAGPVWSFRVGSIPIVVNTADFNETFNGVDYNALTMTFTDTSIVKNGTLGTDDVVIFDLSDHNNIAEEYEFYVIPEFNDAVQDEANGLHVRRTSRPMAIHVTGDFIFDGRMDISGETVITLGSSGNKTYSPTGRCGGYRGPRNNDSDSSVSPEETQYSGYWSDIDSNDRFDDAFQGVGTDNPVNPVENRTRRIHFISSDTDMPAGPPTRYAMSGKSMFGPGGGSTGAQNTGGGGGYGGIGGDSSQGYTYGNFAGGVTYGDKEVPVPFGGSAGGFGKNAPACPGGAGGGGVEIAATGDITLGPHAQIVANGGSTPNDNDYAAGGGAGGSVRLIAGGDVSIAETAVVSVNGGNGGNSVGTGFSWRKTGAGGAGGRVAIWYGGTCDGEEVITANGGAPGVGEASDSKDCWTYSEPGQDGTILVSNGDKRKASAPTPRNGDKMVYCNPDPCTIKLKWYSGYGGTTDEVFCDNNSTPTTSRGSVSATRGQHDVNMTVSAGKTYYMKVVTDGTVSSDVWSFKTVNWYCDEKKFNERAQWDSGPYNNCSVDFEDFAYFAQFWFKRDNMNLGPAIDGTGDGGLTKFMKEWLQMTGRGP